MLKELEIKIEEHENLINQIGQFDDDKHKTLRLE